MITREIALEKLRRQLHELEGLLKVYDPRSQYGGWKKKTEVVLEQIFKDNPRHLQSFQAIRYSLMMFSGATPDSEFIERFKGGMESARSVLNAAILEVDEYWSDEASDQIKDNSTPAAAVGKVQRICSRFHLVARQLRHRHANRPTLDVADEYDVQDCLNALLRVEFDDVRDEEWTPSYAGKSARMDFLLKGYDVVVEAKMTRAGLADKQVGDELLVDIQRYRAHPDCKVLVCFVYDPEGRMKNPRGLEADLNQKDPRLEVRVIVVPSGL